MDTDFAPYTSVNGGNEPEIAQDEQTESLLADLERASDTLSLFRRELKRVVTERDSAREDAERQRDALASIRTKLLEVVGSLPETW